jgi:hypothetical protein
MQQKLDLKSSGSQASRFSRMGPSWHMCGRRHAGHCPYCDAGGGKGGREGGGLVISALVGTQVMVVGKLVSCRHQMSHTKRQAFSFVFIAWSFGYITLRKCLHISQGSRPWSSGRATGWCWVQVELQHMELKRTLCRVPCVQNLEDYGSQVLLHVPGCPFLLSSVEETRNVLIVTPWGLFCSFSSNLLTLP